MAGEPTEPKINLAQSGNEHQLSSDPKETIKKAEALIELSQQYDQPKERESGDSTYWLRYTGKNVLPWPSVTLRVRHHPTSENGFQHPSREDWSISTQKDGSVIISHEFGVSPLDEDTVVKVRIDENGIIGDSAPRGVRLGEPHDKGRLPTPLSDNEAQTVTEDAIGAIQLEIANLSKVAR